MVHESAGGLVITVNDKPSITLGGEWEPVTTCLYCVNGIDTFDEVLERVGKLGVARDDARDILTFCLDENIVEYVYPESQEPGDDLSAYELMKWDRQIKNFATLDGKTGSDARDFQGALGNSHVVIVGVGGVGSYLALSAAMMGIGRVTLVDFDSIELSNTSRQVLYTEDDLGRTKIETAADRLRAHNPRTRYHLENREISSSSDLEVVLDRAEARLGAIDFVFISADTPRGKIQYIADDACTPRGIAWMNLGPFGFSKAQVGPIIVPGVTESYAQYFPRTLIDGSNSTIGEINARFEANIMDSYNGIAAKMGMIEAVKFLTGYARPAALGAVVELDTADWSTRVHVCE